MRNRSVTARPDLPPSLAGLAGVMEAKGAAGGRNGVRLPPHSPPTAHSIMVSLVSQLDQSASRPDQSAGRPDPVVGQPDPVVGQPDPVVGQPDPVVGQPDPVVGQPDPVVGQPDPVV